MQVCRILPGSVGLFVYQVMLDWYHQRINSSVQRLCQQHEDGLC